MLKCWGNIKSISQQYIFDTLLKTPHYLKMWILETSPYYYPARYTPRHYTCLVWHHLYIIPGTSGSSHILMITISQTWLPYEYKMEQRSTQPIKQFRSLSPWEGIYVFVFVELLALVSSQVCGESVLLNSNVTLIIFWYDVAIWY